MAMTAPAVGVLPSLPSSFSAPLTPRAQATKLGFDPSMAGITVPILATRAIPAPATEAPTNGTQIPSEPNGADDQPIRTSLDGISDHDGRITPVPNADATIRRNRPQSPRSILPPRQQPLMASSSSSQPATSSGIPILQAPLPAHVGLGTLHGEEQLKISLQSKDRIFVVMLSKEIEAFLQRCVAGETLDDAQTAVSQPGGAALAIFGNYPTIKIQSLGTSKFQRMLVYKAAEWYGAKAVPGPENVIFLGLLGTLPEKSLKLVTLVPERETVQQKFKIMQRSQPVGASRSGSSADGGDGGPTSRKTLEQREAEYAAERERIYGSEASQEPEEASDRPAPRRVEDDIDPVSRYAYGADPMAYDPIYAGYPDLSAQIDPSQHMSNGTAYYVNNQPVPYPGYMAQGMQYASVNGGYAGQPMYAQQAYDQHGNPIMLVPQQMNGYAPMWQAQPMPGNGNGGVQQQGMQPMMAPGTGQVRGSVNGNGAGGNGWSPYQQHQQMAMPPPNSNGQYGFPTPGYPNLMHPQPTRPNPQPHSSASSSISSQSYHSHNHSNHSRPHSRGSVTSTRSATSSARFGQMYPANVGYRQKAIKGGVNGLTTLGIAQDRRSTRGQSPSSTTTASSRSSRRDTSIPVQPPGQFPLPQRPDWAKDNVAYQPTSITTTTQPGMSPRSDMVVGQVYYPNGAGHSGSATTLSSDGFTPSWSSGGPSGAASPMSRVISRQPSHPSPSISTNGHTTETPYRPRPSQALFDPSNPSSSRPASSNGNRIPSFTPNSAPYPIVVEGSGMSPEEIIEAKLQALSFSTGMAIGPPPVRQAAASGGPSYAKVVRRD